MQNHENSIPKSEESVEKAKCNFSEAGDKELHKQFVRLGNDRRKLTNELLALLPEINERGIHKVAMVASLATPENEEVLVDKIKNIV